MLPDNYCPYYLQYKMFTFDWNDSRVLAISPCCLFAIWSMFKKNLEKKEMRLKIRKEIANTPWYVNLQTLLILAIILNAYLFFAKEAVFMIVQFQCTCRLSLASMNDLYRVWLHTSYVLPFFTQIYIFVLSSKVVQVGSMVSCDTNVYRK
jgi:hypothetical protein